MKKDFFSKAGNALKVPKDQLEKIGSVSNQIKGGLDSLNYMHKQDSEELDMLIEKASHLCRRNGIDTGTVISTNVDFSEIDSLLETISADNQPLKVAVPVIEKIDAVDTDGDWNDYLQRIDCYAEKNEIDFTKDPFEDLLSADERNAIVQKINDDYKLQGKVNCDKWDYIFAATSGAITGIIDSFFVGMPGKSKLGNWTNTQADKLVEKFSKIVYKADQKHIEKLLKNGSIKKASDYCPNGEILPKKEPDGIASSIGYLEKRFKVPYDARYAKDLKSAEGHISFNPNDHHLKSMGHCFDLAGLFFSILDQFTGKTTIISNGRIARFENKSSSFELRGNNFYEKIIFGVINWFGHIMSDLAGSSGTRGHERKIGSGIAAPFFEFFQLCDIGTIKVGEDTKTLASFTTAMYQNGYDARFAAAQAIPVALNEVLIRLFWSIKRHYYHKMKWKECIPIKLSNKPELRRMLLVGHGCLCLVDAADAAIRSGGEIMSFALHINFVAWTKFANLGFQEIRALYNKDALNVEEMDSDLKAEWNILLDSTEIA